MISIWMHIIQRNLPACFLIVYLGRCLEIVDGFESRKGSEN